MAIFKSEITASEAIEENMKDYGEYTIKSKFPNDRDGLKPIHRRVLWRLHQDPKLQKEATLVGLVMKMHPHGDNSIADTISNMAQPFSNIIPLVYSDSNIGTYVGDSPAAARYVDVAEAEVAKDLFFTHVSTNTFTFVPCESEEGLEPENFIPILPTALLTKTLGIAIGFKTDTIALSVNDICELSKAYVGLRTGCIDWTAKLHTLIKYMIPDFPTACTIRNSKQLLAAYQRGEFLHPIVIDGTMFIRNDRIIIETLPYGKSFGEVTLKAGMQTKIKDSWTSQHFQQLEDFSDKKQGVHKGQFNCVVRRGENPYHLLQELKKMLGFTVSWKPSRLYVANTGNKTEETPFTLLDKWYTDRKRSVLGELKQRQNKLMSRRRELLALVIITDHADEVYKIFKNAETKEDTIPILCKRFKLTLFQAKFIASLTLAQMTNRGRHELLEDIEKNKKDISELQHRFMKVDDAIIDTIDKFQKKYSSTYPRKCVIPKYIGNICFKQNGYTQVESIDEIEQILRAFDPEHIDINFYNTGTVRQLGFVGDKDVDLPKHLVANYLGTTKGATPYTACITPKGSLIVEGSLQTKEQHMTCVTPIGKKFIGITNKGYLHHMIVEDKFIRKSSSSSASMSDIIHISNLDEQDVIVAHVNDREPNIIRLDRKVGNGRLSRVVVGKWKVIGVYSVDKPFVLSIPTDCRNRCIIRHVYVDNATKYLKEGQTIQVNLSKKTINTGGTVQLFNRRSSIYKLNTK